MLVTQMNLFPHCAAGDGDGDDGGDGGDAIARRLYAHHTV